MVSGVGILDWGQQRATDDEGLEHLTHMKRLRILGLLSLVKGNLENLIWPGGEDMVKMEPDFSWWYQMAGLETVDRNCVTGYSIWTWTFLSGWSDTGDQEVVKSPTLETRSFTEVSSNFSHSVILSIQIIK